jgi:membrane associated rhomboid family serine protease
MGIQNRDYIRERERHDGMGGDISATPVVKWILIVTIVVYLIQLFLIYEFGARTRFQNPGETVVQQWLRLDVDQVSSGQIWRLLTCALVHDPLSLWHIAVNMIVLVWFGRSLELHYGSREFLLFYLTGILVASLSHIAIQLFLGERVPAIGASGGVMAVFCLFALWNPGYTVSLYFFIPVPVIWLLGLYVLFDLHPLILQLSGVPHRSGVAHAAHLGGIGFAYFYYQMSWSLEQWFEWLPWKPKSLTHRPLKLTPRRQAELEQQELKLDEILAKISREGEASLTAKEREILQAASQRYREKPES